MRLVVYSHTSTFYGASRSILELTSELKNRDIEIIYLLPEKGDFYSELIKLDYKVYLLPNPEWICTPRKEGYSPYFYFKHLLKLRFKFLYTFLSVFRKHYKLLKELNPDWVIVNTSVSPIGLIIAKLLNYRVILWARESILNKEGWEIRGLFPEFLMTSIIKFADLVITPSSFLAIFFKKKFNLNLVHVIDDPVVFDEGINKIHHHGVIKIGLVGNITDRKGQLKFCEALFRNNNDNYCVILYGDGDEGLLRKIKACSHQIQIFPFEGNRKKIYESFDVYVNMGVDESFGRTTVEAMRMKKLVFGLNSGATPEIIQNGVNGFVFNEPKEVFEKLEFYFNSEENIKIIEKIIDNGYDYSMRYKSDNVVNKFLALITNV